MDVGNDNGWNIDKVVTKKEMLEQIGQHFEIETVESDYDSEVATYDRHNDDSAQYLIITSVSASYCSTCVRARISSDRKIYGCRLAEKNGYEIKTELGE